MDKAIKTYRMMEIFKVLTTWEITAPVNSTPEEIVDFFESNAATKEQVKVQVDKIWSRTMHGVNTPKYYNFGG